MRDRDTQLLTEAYREAAVHRYLIKEGFPGKGKIKNWILKKLDGFKEWLDGEGQEILRQRGILKEDFVLQEGMGDWVKILGIGGIISALALYLKMDQEALQSVLDFFPDLLDHITDFFGGGLSPPNPMDPDEANAITTLQGAGVPTDNLKNFGELMKAMKEGQYSVESAVQFWEKLDSVDPDLGAKVTNIINKGNPEQLDQLFDWMKRIDETPGAWDALAQNSPESAQDAMNAATKARHAADSAPMDSGTSSVLQRPGSWLPGGEKAYLGSQPGPGE